MPTEPATIAVGNRFFGDFRRGGPPCRVYWGSHGCDLVRGHVGPHRCACADDGDIEDLREAIRKAAGEPTGEELEEALRRAGKPSTKVAVLPSADGYRMTYLLAPTDITAVTLPCHDPPVAWRVEKRWGMWPVNVVVCPAMDEGAIAFAHVIEGCQILDAEPGRRP